MKFATTRSAATVAAVAATANAAAGTKTEPCAAVSSAWAAQIAATPTPVVEAKLAYKCLNSVPINKEGALHYISSMKPFVEWQSDVIFKKNPPAEYDFPAYDVWAVIEEVEDNIKRNKYHSEFAWQEDLYIKLWGPGKDGHFVNYPDILTNAVEWQRPFALVSVSDEPAGNAPEIKVYSDVIKDAETASTVKKINEKDAEEWLLEWVSMASGNRDIDSAYNSLFWESSFVAELASTGYFQNGGRTRYIYPGKSTSFKFENGTHLKLDNEARLKGDWTGVVDGPSFFKKFAPGAFAANGKPSATSTPATPTATPTPAPTTNAAVPGYPEPVIVSSDGVISGYYLEGEGFDDTAVLVALSFSPSNPTEFQHVAQDFFAGAKAAGKKNLVVDVSANGGGYIFSGYDLFRQLFPDIVQEGLGRWRENPGFLAATEVYSKDSANFDPDTASSETIQEYESIFNWRFDLNESNKHFESYDAKFAPHVYLGDSFTNVMQWDFNDPLNTANATYGFGTDITGYRSRANFTRPFAGPENVVVLLDGFCASTCTLFSQFMFHQAGVKAVSMGGRGSHEGLIQGVGGVKGSQSLGYEDVLSYLQLALENTNDTAQIEALTYDEYVIDRSQVASLNVKDEIYRDHLDDGLPAQFVAEFSECRLFWTPEMLGDVSEVWKAAADSAFNGAKCAYGGIEKPSGYPAPPSGYPTAPYPRPHPRRTAAAPPKVHRDASHYRALEMSPGT